MADSPNTITALEIPAEDPLIELGRKIQECYDRKDELYRFEKTPLGSE